MLYSKSSGAFYDPTIFTGKIPSDAVEIDDATHAALLQAQSEGKSISTDSAGNPVAVATQMSDDEIQEAKEAVVQGHLDAAARARGYDSIASAVSYAGSDAVPRFQQEGKAFLDWRALVWEKCYEILAAVKAGTESVPDDAALVAQLPPLVLPDVQQ